MSKLLTIKWMQLLVQIWRNTEQMANNSWTIGGFIFILFWNFNRNHTKKDRYWQKITFYFFIMFKNVQFFSHLHFKIAKSAIMTQTFFFLKNSNLGIKKRRILCWFQIRWCQLSEMPLTKVKSKKPRKNAQKRKYSKFA